jgi:NitT/TauT family transport system permease protein
MSVAAAPLSEDVATQAFVGERERRLAIVRRNWIISLAAPLVLLLLWQVLATVGILDQRFFSSPALVLQYLWSELTSLRLLRDARDTLIRVAIGFLLGATPGLLLGVSMGLSRWVNVAIRPIIRVTYPIPHASLLPLVLLIFGTGEASKYVLAGLGAFYNMLICSAAAVQNVEKVHLDVARDLGASRLTILRSVALPSALPELFSGVRLAWGASLLLIVIVEFVGSSSGLGFRIWRSWQLFAIEPMFVGLIAVAAVAFLSYALLNYLQMRLVPWKK